MEGTRLTKEDRKGDRQTDRMEEIENDHDKLSDENSLWEGYNQKRRIERWGGGKSPHTIIRQEPEKPEMRKH